MNIHAHARLAAFAAAALLCLSSLGACGDGGAAPATASSPDAGLDAGDIDADAPDAGEGESDGDAGEDAGEPDAGEHEAPPQEPVCGDGRLDDGEVCDDGNLAPGDGCDERCAIERRQALFMSWNVQAEHLDWGGSAVEPRAAALHALLDDDEALPGVIALQEFSPAWHGEENFGWFEALGYALAIDDDGLYTEVAYRPDLYELVEAGRLPIASNYAGELVEKKTCVTWAALRELTTGKRFIALSTHWDPNNGLSKDMTIKEMLLTLVALEEVRSQGARQSAALIEALLLRFPGAHVVYAGDFNTVDLKIVDRALGTLVSGTTLASLLALFGIDVGDGFTGSHETLGQASGLIDARSEAIALGLAVNDVATTGDPAIPDFLAESGVPVVIDYAFHSADLALTSYEVMDAAAYRGVSDHNPLRVSFEYDAL